MDRFTASGGNIMPFRNRSEAGRRLTVALGGYKEQEPTVPGMAEYPARRSLQ